MIIVRQVVYIELHTVASFVYFCFFEDGERESFFWPLFIGVLWPRFGTIFGFLGLLAWGVWVSSTNFFVTTIPYEGLIINISEFYPS